jgi:hypothetical protein
LNLLLVNDAYFGFNRIFINIKPVIKGQEVKIPKNTGFMSLDFYGGSIPFIILKNHATASRIHPFILFMQALVTKMTPTVYYLPCGPFVTVTNHLSSSFY